MKTKVLLSMAACALMLSNCSNEEIESSVKTDTVGTSLYATMEAPVASRSTAEISESTATFAWAEGDEISVSTTDGFKTMTYDATEEKFTSTEELTFSDVAYYPSGSHTAEKFVMPTSYDLDDVTDNTNAPMRGEISEGAVAFKHLGGVVRLTLNNVPANATKLVFTANNAITGDFTPSAADGEEYSITSTSVTATDNNKSVTLNFTASTSADKVFYVPVPVGDYTFSIALYAGEETTALYEKSSSDTEVKVSRATLVDMPELDCATGVSSNSNLQNLLDAGTPIKLTENITLTTNLSVTKDAVIDLDTYTLSGNISSTGGLINVSRGATLIIKGTTGALKCGENGPYAGILLTTKSDTGEEPANVIIEGGTIEGMWYGISGNGSRPNTNVTINGGTITSSKGLGIFHPQAGILTINDGTIEGVLAAVEMRAGTLNINGGIFTSTATSFSATPNGSGSTIVGAAIAVSQHSTNNELKATISNGTFNGIYALYEEDTCDDNNVSGISLSVTGGTFNGLVYSENCSSALENITASATLDEKITLAAGSTLNGGGATMEMNLQNDNNSIAIGISTSGGTIQDLTIEGDGKTNTEGKGYRAIYIQNATENVVINNVHISGVAYPINTGGNIAENLRLTVSSSALIGWTSFASFASATFTNCTFGIGTYYQSEENPAWDGTVKPYITTTFDECTFEKGFYIDFSELEENQTITFKNCKVKDGETTIDLTENDSNVNWVAATASNTTITFDND